MRRTLAAIVMAAALPGCANRLVVPGAYISGCVQSEFETQRTVRIERWWPWPDEVRAEKVYGFKVLTDSGMKYISMNDGVGTDGPSDEQTIRTLVEPGMWIKFPTRYDGYHPDPAYRRGFGTGNVGTVDPDDVTVQ